MTRLKQDTVRIKVKPRWRTSHMSYEGGRGPPSFRPNGAVDSSLKIHLLSADLLRTRVQPRLVSRQEREKLEISCLAKWAYNNFVIVPL